MASSRRSKSNTLRSHLPMLLGSDKGRFPLLRFALGGLLVLCTSLTTGHGQQIGDGTGQRSVTTAFFTIGGENTQLPAYADNALGFDMGISTQPHRFLGAEFRAGAYPISARYVQMPFTGGYRIAGTRFFGFPYAPFAYFGGGVARSQDEYFGRSQYAPQWARCWQTDIGLDRTYGTFSWRVIQINYRRTYTPLHSLRGLGLSTGIVYRFKR